MSTQRRLARWCVDYVDREGYPPSYREIATGVGLVSLSTVHHHLQQMHDLGLIRLGGGSRAIDVRPTRAWLGRPR